MHISPYLWLPMKTRKFLKYYKYICLQYLFTFSGYNKSLPLVSGSTVTRRITKARCSIRSTESLPEGFGPSLGNMPGSNNPERDDVSLYGTPKEEVYPLISLLIVAYHCISLHITAYHYISLHITADHCI